MKQCPSCGGDGPFGKNRARPDGLQDHCKKCRSNRQKRPEDKAKSNARNRAYRKRIGTSYYRNYQRIRRQSEYARKEDRAYSSKWKKENPDKVAAQVNRRRAKRSGAGGSYTSDEFLMLVSHAGGRCLCCGRKRKLVADHVVPIAHGGSSDVDNIQPLCTPCNSSKGAKTIDYRRGHLCLR